MERKSFAFSFIRIFLSVVLVISLMPAISQPAFADEADTTEPVAAQVDDAAVVDGEDEPTVQEPEQDATHATELSAQAEKQPEDQSDEQPEAKPLGFVYFGESDLTAGADQVVALAIDDEALTVASATLTYTDPQGAKHEVASERCADSAALFSVPTAGSGTYQLVELKAVVKTAAGKTKTVVVDLAKEGKNCAFEAAPDMGTTLSVQSEGEASDADDVTVYALNAQGEMEEANDIISAAAIAGGISTQANTPTGKFVIALDPGHGGTNSGATNAQIGLKESDVNWKIAQYCKTELEKYAGIDEVYVTRAQNECPGQTERVNRAMAKGAKVFVSLHINSADATNATGAEVWYPNDSSFNKTAHTEGKELSQKILNELVALGLTNRGIKTRDATSATYSDGQKADYYTVINAARRNGIPGIIVEHAFISNLDEAKKLADDSFLKKLGVADATGIAKTYGLVKGKWEEQSDGTWKYKQADGTYAKNQWVTVSGKQYWMNDKGIMVTGVRNINGALYCFDGSGAKMSKTGWHQIGSTWYYLKAGVPQTGWLKSGKSWYYLDRSTGKMATGWITDTDGKKYYLNASGAMRGAGWLNDGGTWYYLNGSGAAVTGWLKSGGKWYWFDKSTAKMATGWTTADDKKYYLNASGAMRGAGWFKDGSNWHWITSSGAAASGWQKISGKWYYFDPSTTVMHAGWTKVSDTWYFLDGNNGDMKTGWLKQGGTWYYLNSSGAMLTGWQTIGGKKYYLDENGKMLAGYHTLAGQPCFFESSGVFVGHGTPIMGASQTTAAKMAQAYIASGNVYPAAELAKGDAPDIQTFCKIIEEEAKAEGVRAEVVWAQVMLETGWLRFGNDVKINQFNFAGLGATGGGEPGNVFPDVRTGIRAQVQHLKCYASTEPLNQARVDQRWSSNLRGKAVLVEWLGIPDNPNHTGWAAGANYGAKLIGLMRDKLGCQ